MQGNKEYNASVQVSLKTKNKFFTDFILLYSIINWKCDQPFLTKKFSLLVRVAWEREFVYWEGQSFSWCYPILNITPFCRNHVFTRRIFTTPLELSAQGPTIKARVWVKNLKRPCSRSRLTSQGAPWIKLTGSIVKMCLLKTWFLQKGVSFQMG